SITLRIPLFQAKEMTLPQQNIASARPTSFYYLMCQLDRVQYLVQAPIITRKTSPSKLVA
ncbi:MAG: hypothetical protein LKJ72_05020, partial [[Lactobacillus] timonensis]|uniref:hypothetical protein n=1 Tax=[Lactobacillus] timonensis TaxID=1970790 RepID=UPI0023551FBD